MIVEHKFLALKDGTELHICVKEMGAPRWLIFVHGIGEHSGRHLYLNDLFAGSYNILTFDLRGHGRSTGQKTYVKDFSQYQLDLQELLTKLKETYRIKKYALMGHSMGALIISGYMQQLATKDFYPERVFLSAPPVGMGGPLGGFVNLLPRELFEKASGIPYGAPLSNLLDLKYLSHDPRIKNLYITDELCSTAIHSHTLFELVRFSKEIYSRPLRIDVPTFCAIGGGDKIVSVKAASEYFNLIEKGVRFHLVPDAYHEMHNEIERYRKPYFDFLKSSLVGSDGNHQ